MKIFRDPDSEQSYGDIVDVFWLKDDPDLLAEMLEFALADFHQQGIVLGTIWLQTNTLLDQIGRETGFMETNQRRYFCCKVLGNEYSALNEPEQWSLTMADSEIY